MGSAQFRINEPEVIHQLFDRELVAVHLTRGTYHTLPGIAGDAFLLLGAEGAALHWVASELAARYEAPLELIEHDLGVMFLELEEQSLVVRAASSPDRPPTASVPNPREQLLPYAPPRLESFSDLQELFLLDPVHDVGAQGWPNAAAQPDEGADSVPRQQIRCRINEPSVIFERFDQETVVMNLGTGACHTLSGPAEDIFLLMSHTPTVGEIRQAMLRTYAVEPAELDAGLVGFLDQLEQAGLITRQPIPEAPERDLELARSAPAPAFFMPTLETFSQASFDAPGEAGPALDNPGPSPRASGPVGRTIDPFLRSRYRLREGDLLFSSAAGETVISDRDNGTYFKLNQAASDAFRLLARERDIDEVVAALGRKYDVPKRDLRAAVVILLWNLRKLELVAPAPVEASAEEAPMGEVSGKPRVPFSGFDVLVHRDLEDLMRPFNSAVPTVPARPASDARQFLALLELYFQEAAGARRTENTYSVAGRTMRIVAADTGQLTDLAKAFEHRVGAQTAGADLTIHAWSAASALPGKFLGPVLQRLYEDWSTVCGPRGEVLEFHGPRASVIYHPGPDTLSVVDNERNLAYYLTRDDTPLPFWELSSPFRHILHPWFGARGLQYTHAGAVGGPLGGVLLVGKGGSGKSTTSLLCVSDGLQYAGDDYCLTDASSGHVHSLYNTAKLKGAADLDRVPSMRGRSFNSDSFEHGGAGKGTFRLSELWPQLMSVGFPIRAILLPVVTSERDTRLEPCSPGDALLALAPSTVAQLPVAGQVDCARLAALAEKAPAFRLHLGSDLDQIPALIRTLIQ